MTGAGGLRCPVGRKRLLPSRGIGSCAVVRCISLLLHTPPGGAFPIRPAGGGLWATRVLESRHPIRLSRNAHEHAHLSRSPRPGLPGGAEFPDRLLLRPLARSRQHSFDHAAKRSSWIELEIACRKCRGITVAVTRGRLDQHH